jgi:hypothetical protein
VVMLDQKVFLVNSRLDFTATTVPLFATTSLSITHVVISRLERCSLVFSA